MTSRRPTALAVLSCALLVLLPLLAILQYRWVGQVSEAERERMRRTLSTAAVQFSRALDAEMARAVFSLRVGEATFHEESWTRYADRYETWRASTMFPRFVAAVYLVDDSSGALRLRQWDAVAETFRPAPWPAWLAAERPQLEELRRRPDQTRRRAVRHGIDDSVLIAPVADREPGRSGDGAHRADREFGFTILHLDLDVIAQQMIPTLVRQHFVDRQGQMYRVAVVGRPPAPRTLFLSDNGAAITPADADVQEPIFNAFSRPAAAMDQHGAAAETRAGDGEPQRFRAGGGRWLLLVQHPAGSLEAAVAALRLRNLGVGLGAMLLVCVSILLLLLSARRARRLAQQQMEFVAGVSHELRTPVAVIRSAAENLAHGVVSRGDHVRQYGQMLEAESRRLGEMVERVLEYADLETGFGEAARVPVHAAALVNEAITAAGPSLSGVSLERRVAGEVPPLLGDRPALRSAVRNLLVNAAKYGGHDRWVRITVDTSTLRGRLAVRISVDDHGPGIPSEELSHIFKPFYRGAEAVARQSHGSGLGLSLVKRIVDAHRGEVRVYSRVGEGTSFVLTLPAAAQPHGVESAQGAMEGAVHP